ncbi:MAG TPA: DUF488 domain-containing protein [Candidatus Dormibacteraeota bacterium]|nr:DUF488 domain-containing protein [Candidatus Dormibacteraeota bacterium]
MALFTVGHSTRSLDELLDLLHSHEVTLLADVRTVPRSRRLPHFDLASLAVELPRRGVEYVHLPELGGLRRPRPDSPNQGWRNAGFRGYADHMDTPEFRAGLERLARLGRDRDVAFMCAEAVPWRCHRSLLADALVARGIPVRHIVGAGRSQAHALTPFAHVEGDRITYPGAAARGQRR